MAMSLLSIAAAAATSSPLPLIRRISRHKPTTTVVSFPLKPQPLRFSRIHCSSGNPTTSLLSPITSTSRTLLFLLVASLLSLSGVHSLPSLASPPPPTQQPQETKEQEDQQEPEEEDKVEEAWQQPDDEGEDVEEEVEEAWLQPEEGEDDKVEMYLEVLSSDPGNVDALKCVLFAKMRRTDWDGALGYARRLREAEPGEVEWRLMEALLHELKGDLAGAERLFRELLAEKPLLLRALHVG